MIIKKSGKGNYVAIVDRQDYIKQMNNIFSYQKKFTMVNMNDDTLLNFALNQEKNKSLKPVGSRPGVMYGSYKAHKASVENCPQFVGQLPVLVACHCPNLSALNTPIYKREILGANFKTFVN